VLIIDGTSSDDTVKIVNQFQQIDKRIHCLSENDKGIYDAMNKGILKSKGEWLFFLGSDDSFYNKNVLSDVQKIIVENPESKFIYGDVYMSTGKVQTYSNYNYERLLAMNICHQSIFYHRSLFADKIYDVNYKICADWDFNLKIFNSNNRPLYINKIVSNYNLNGASAEWDKIPEFVTHFSNPRKLALRYRGIAYFVFYFAKNVLRKVKSKLSPS
jgi:glycosyltransferase involved in cell wall biosynthesis